MELWVRSQNKEILQKTNALFICHSEESIWSIIDNQNMTKYGTYKTKERALEVLNEIQNKLKNEDNDLINKLKILENTPIVNCMNNDDCEINVNLDLLKNMIIYEMPEE